MAMFACNKYINFWKPR